MSNNTVTLTTEIKNSLRSMNYPVLIIGSLFISFLGWLMVLGHNPNLMDSSFESHLRFTLSMAILLIVLLMGIVIGMGIAHFYKPRVLRYVNVPNDIETVKDGLIALGSFVTTLENTVNSKVIGKIFYNIISQLKKIPLIQSNVSALKIEIAELKKQMKTKEQSEKIVDDLSFNTIRQQKELDKFQTRLDEY